MGGGFSTNCKFVFYVCLLSILSQRVSTTLPTHYKSAISSYIILHDLKWIWVGSVADMFLRWKTAFFIFLVENGFAWAISRSACSLFLVSCLIYLSRSFSSFSDIWKSLWRQNSFFSLIWVCDKKIHENSQHSVLLSNLERRESDKMSDTLPDWQTERQSELPNLLLIVSDVQEGVSHHQNWL